MLLERTASILGYLGAVVNSSVVCLYLSFIFLVCGVIRIFSLLADENEEMLWKFIPLVAIIILCHAGTSFVR